MNLLYRNIAPSIYNLVRLHINYKMLNIFFKLKRVKNKYNGENAIILSNGPSLNSTDLNLTHT
jgi:hypothetical protein